MNVWRVDKGQEDSCKKLRVLSRASEKTGPNYCDNKFNVAVNNTWTFLNRQITSQFSLKLIQWVCAIKKFSINLVAKELPDMPGENSRSQKRCVLIWPLCANLNCKRNYFYEIKTPFHLLWIPSCFLCVLHLYPFPVVLLSPLSPSPLHLLPRC